MITVRQTTPGRVADILSGAVSPKTDPGGAHNLADLLATGTAYEILEGGDIVGAFLVQPFGAELWITAAAGRADLDLCQAMAKATEHYGREFDSIVFTTVRPGLIKKAIALGYTCTMKKAIQ